MWPSWQAIGPASRGRSEALLHVRLRLRGGGVGTVRTLTPRRAGAGREG